MQHSNSLVSVIQRKHTDFSFPEKNIECTFFDNSGDAVFIFCSDDTIINFRLSYEPFNERKYCVDVKVTHKRLPFPFEALFDDPRLFPHSVYKDEELRVRAKGETDDSYGHLIYLIEVCLNIIRVNRNILFFPMLQ